MNVSNGRFTSTLKSTIAIAAWLCICAMSNAHAQATTDTDGDGIPDSVEASVGRNPTVKDNDVFADDRLFVMQQFRDFYFREAAASEVTIWLGRMAAGMDRAAVIEQLLLSAEHADLVGPQARLYFAYFLRLPDPQGFDFWITQYRNRPASGWSFEGISEFFSLSPEFQQRYGALTTDQFVTLIYRNVLNRAPEPSGFAFWKDELDSGRRIRGNVMAAFSESPENKQLKTHDVRVAALFFGMLRSVPAANTFDTWVNQLKQGGNIQNLINEIIAQPAYRARFLAPVQPPPVVGAPAIFFTDVTAGPTTTGPNNAGVPIAIFGKGFGAARGTSTVTINGNEVARYLVWGENNANNAMLDMIVVQPGANVTSGPMVVNVNGTSSNSEHTFAPTGGTVYYVAPGGSDSASCTEAQPCATVLHATTNVMKPGDAVLLRGGPMNDDEVWIRAVNGNSGEPAKPKIIRNYPGEAPEFGKGARPFIVDADYITVSGVEFKNGKPLVVGFETSRGNRMVNNTFRGTIGFDAIGTHGDDILLAGNDCDVAASTVGTQGHCYYISNGSNIRLLYNIGRGAPGYGIHIFDQLRSTNDYKRVISNVLVEGNWLASSPERSGLIVAMSDEGALGNYIDGVTIRNNIFVANNFAGIAVGGVVRNVRIYHNTFYRNGRQGITLYDEATVDGVDIVNNLFDQTSNTNCQSNCSWYADAHIQKGARSKNVTITNNHYTPGTPIVLGASDGAASTGDPGFINGAASNFDLAAASTAIDKGATLPAVTRDFYGRPRPIGTKPDAGAFERP